MGDLFFGIRAPRLSRCGLYVTSSDLVNLLRGMKADTVRDRRRLRRHPGHSRKDALDDCQLAITRDEVSEWPSERENRSRGAYT